MSVAKTTSREEPPEPKVPGISPSSLYNLLKPSRCDLRVWLESHGFKEEPPDAFREVLFDLGHAHEARHLRRFPHAVDVAELPREDQEAATLGLLRERRRVIYQGALRARTTLAGREIEVTGHPDFMLPAREQWAIRDSKLNRNVSDYIVFQLHIYGWLYEQTMGAPPVALQVHSGSDEIIDVPYERETVEETLGLLERMIELRFSDERPNVHVSNPRCAGCGFREHCWPQAIERREVGLLPAVDRGAVQELHERGAGTIPELLANFDVASLAALERSWAGRMKPVGEEYAERILAGARAFETGQPIVLAEPELPDAKSWVMFDLEGMPPRLDELEKIYIWGLQVFGESAGGFRPAVAGFGPHGDREGWSAFLDECEAILDEHGDIPFVHWATYEQVKLDMYVTRYGDPDGIAARIKANLLDLLPITRASVAVPVSSYGLKDVEIVAGYERRLEEYGGSWSMARYIEATECDDKAERAAIVDEILSYNREDLEATWAVLEWLGRLGARA
jgi:predicted RecB family nuclease